MLNNMWSLFIKLILVGLMIVSCAMLRDDTDTLRKYFKISKNQNKKEAFHFLTENIPHDGYANVQIKKDDKFYKLNGAFDTPADYKRYFKFFITETFIIEKCHDSSKPKECFVKKYTAGMNNTKYYENDYTEDKARRALEGFCRVECSGYLDGTLRDICHILNSASGQSWKNGQTFLKRVCNE